VFLKSLSKMSCKNLHSPQEAIVRNFYKTVGSKLKKPQCPSFIFLVDTYQGEISFTVFLTKMKKLFYWISTYADIDATSISLNQLCFGFTS